MRGEFFLPRLANREKRQVYRPDDSALARARSFVAELRAAPQRSRLDPQLRERLLSEFPEIVI